MHKYLTELIGMFLFVFSIGLVVLAHTPFAPLVIGSVLMVIVYMGGHVSGGHYNPAVSFAVMLRGKLGVIDFVIYVVCQLVGAVAASLTVYLIRDQTFGVAPSKGMGSFAVIFPDLLAHWDTRGGWNDFMGSLAVIFPALLVEIIFTFALALVVLNVATAKKTEGNSFYGLAIGFTVVVAAFSAGGISGGAFNPAIGTGPNIVDAVWSGGSVAHVWLYWVGPMAGAAFAAIVFKVQEAGSSES